MIFSDLNVSNCDKFLPWKYSNGKTKTSGENEILVINEKEKNLRKMKSTQSGRRTCVSLIVILLAVARVSGTRPEVILADVLTKPFVPRQFASSECIRDGEIYLKALERYTPWALQSK